MVVPILGLVAVVLAGALALRQIAGRRELAPVGDESAPTSFHERALTQGAGDRLLRPMLESLGGRIYRLSPPGRTNALRRKIAMGGLQGTWSVEKALALKALGIAGGVTLAIIIAGAKPDRIGIILAILVGAIGLMAIDTVLSNKASARQAEIQRNLPDILDQMTICVEAGLGFDAALHRCSRVEGSPLAEELGRTLQDIRLGVPRSKAMANLLDRTDVADLRLFVRALGQAEKSGVPMAKVLKVQAEEAREKRRQKAEERAMKLPVVLMVPLVLCILPALFLVILGPAALRMMESGVV